MAKELVSTEVVAVGVGAAGLVERATGVHVWGPHVPGPSPIGEVVRAATGLPVALDNDSNAAAFAELTVGAARGASDALVVMLGTGIGGGLIMDGSIYRGQGFAGEIGHMVLDPSGPTCECGLRGCWETLVSGSVLDAAATRLAADDPGGAVARRAGGQSPQGEHLMLAAEEGDPGSLTEWQTAGEWLGRGIAQLTAVLDPEIVVVGGAPSVAGDLLLDPAREILMTTGHGSHLNRHPQVVASRFGRESAVIGAGLQALESFDD
jgi:glucokinase